MFGTCVISKDGRAEKGPCLGLGSEGFHLKKGPAPQYFCDFVDGLWHFCTFVDEMNESPGTLNKDFMTLGLFPGSTTVFHTRSPRFKSWLLRPLAGRSWICLLCSLGSWFLHLWEKKNSTCLPLGQQISEERHYTPGTKLDTGIQWVRQYGPCSLVAYILLWNWLWTSNYRCDGVTVEKFLDLRMCSTGYLA